MKVYGTPICIDCRNFTAVMKKRGLAFQYVNITESTENLKEFLKLRDTEPVFEEVRERGSIGIPLFVKEDGEMSLDPETAMAWIGQPPITWEEMPEHREEDGCADCR